MKNIILILITLVGFILSQECECDCEEPANTWFKVSTADEDYGEIIELDMNNGIATTDGLFIYIIVALDIVIFIYISIVVCIVNNIFK